MAARTGTKIGVAVLSLVGSLAVAELVSRATYAPVLDLDGVPPWEKQPFTPPLNEDGFREEPVGELPETTRRVLLLGDSFTFAHGVVDGAKRFSDLVEARVNAEAEAAGAPERVHLYNAGVPGTNPTHWVKVLNRMLPRYRPDAVVAVFFLRDGTDVDTSISFYQHRIQRLKEEHSLGVLDHLTLARRWADGRIAGEFSDWYQYQFQKAYLGEEIWTERWREVQRALVRLRRICDDAGVPFRMIVFPMLLDLDDYQFHEVEAEITGFAEGEGIDVASLTSAFLGRNAAELWVSSADQHPNETGHAIAAEGLLPLIEDLLRD